jgi:hypothetical protein
MRIVLRLLALVMMIAFIGCASMPQAPGSGPASSGSSGGLSDADLTKMCGQCGSGN